MSKDDKTSQRASKELSGGDLILKREILDGRMLEYEFLFMSSEEYTSRARRISDDRLEWINMKQIRSTGRKVETVTAAPTEEGEKKKRTWTLGVDPIPEEHIKKRSRRK